MRISILTDDLPFGSRIAEGLRGSGHEVRVVGDETELMGDFGDVLVVDPLPHSYDVVAVIRRLSVSGSLNGVRTIAVYPHTDADLRTQVETAGFDAVIPRSRFIREMIDLVEG